MRYKSKQIIISSYDDLKNPVYSGGGAISVHEVAKRFAKDYNVIVLTGTYKGAKQDVIDNVEYRRIGSDKLGHKIGQLVFQLALLKQSLMLKYDLWIESTTPPFTFSLLPLFVKRPIISWVNMLSSYDMQRKYLLNFRFIEQILAKLYRFFIVPTDWVYQEVSVMNKQAVITKIPCGYKSLPLKMNSADKRIQGKYLLFIGRIEVNQKGLDLLIQAIQYTKSKVKLVIAGSGAESEIKSLNSLIERYGLKDRIILVNRVELQDKALLFSKAVATVIPSRFETFSLVALESISYSKPVICFDIPQLSWIPEMYAYKVTPFDVKQLARAIDRLTMLRVTVLPEHSIKPYLRQFTWDSIVSQFETQVFPKLI
jgi:phosphatidyl-myo-inositol alpha-mannosyltransferase